MSKTDKITASENTVLLPVPMLGPELKTPAWIHSIALIKSSGEQDTMRIVIKRDLSVSIKSFTFRYRFSSLPIYVPDEEHKFSKYVYEDDDLNSSELITILGSVPSHLTTDGCCAYISEITLSSGQILEFDSSQFRLIRRPKTKKAPQPEPTSVQTDIPSILPEADVQKATEKKKKSQLSPEKKRRRLIVILAAMVVMFAVEIVGGIALYRYLGVKNSADMLIKEQRFNEAYKIAYDSDYDSVLNRVCKKAVEYYLGNNDLETAYVYAYGSSNSELTDLVIDYATSAVIDVNTGKINENAFRVIKKTDNDDKFTSIIQIICNNLKNRGDFANALRIASEIRDPATRDNYENTVFEEALNYYISNHKYESASSFIDELPNITTFEKSHSDALSAAIDRCVLNNDNAGIIYFSKRYPEAEGITTVTAGTAPGDAGVRAELAIIYPMLTEEQKRTYHSQPIAIWNEQIYRISDGTVKLPGGKITDAVSIDMNEQLCLVLHSDGSISAHPLKGEKVPYTIPKYDDIIDITLGKDHAVLLHADGTVSALGDNTYGQCDVSEWSDIVTVAAGQRFTVGLKTDGTLVAVGYNSCGQCDVEPYRNVVDIDACNQTTVMLFSDGTVMIRGYRSLGLENVESATNVTRIRAGAAAILVEKRLTPKERTYELYTGHSGGSYGDPTSWPTLDAFDVGVMCIAGVDPNGNMCQSGDNMPNKTTQESDS
ncbi:MAG: hypothetical protein IJY93_08520 [Clostridia bacterium]|nr:hypothetical protein [Clostridia bacterium]